MRLQVNLEGQLDGRQAGNFGDTPYCPLSDVGLNRRAGETAFKRGGLGSGLTPFTDAIPVADRSKSVQTNRRVLLRQPSTVSMTNSRIAQFEAREGQR